MRTGIIVQSKDQRAAIQVQDGVGLRQITKSFPGGVVANRGVSCEAKNGEIHAILGENGAGKTTLMKILAGFYRPDSGHVEIDGRQIDFANPRDAKLAGIGGSNGQSALYGGAPTSRNLPFSARRGENTYPGRTDVHSCAAGGREAVSALAAICRLRTHNFLGHT